MTKRVLASLAVTLGVLAFCARPSSGHGIAGGVGVAQAQAPADPDASLDDTAVGGLDNSDADAPVDAAPADPGTAPADPGAAPAEDTRAAQRRRCG